MKRPAPPTKPKNLYKEQVKHKLVKKLRSIARKPERSIKGYVYKLHYKQHTPKKYLKNYWKNFTQPLRRPYLQAKKAYRIGKRIINAGKAVASLHRKSVKQRGVYERKLERYNRQLEKYTKWRNKKFDILNRRREEIETAFRRDIKRWRKDKTDKRAYDDIRKLYEEAKANAPKSIPLDTFEEWKREKQKEVIAKWTKEQLNYIPLVDEKAYEAMLVSPEVIYKYFGQEEHALFGSVENFRAFLGDYFGFGGIVALGVTPQAITRDKNGKPVASGVIKFFKILLKLLATVG